MANCCALKKIKITITFFQRSFVLTFFRVRVIGEFIHRYVMWDGKRSANLDVVERVPAGGTGYRLGNWDVESGGACSRSFSDIVCRLPQLEGGVDRRGVAVVKRAISLRCSLGKFERSST